MSDDKVFKTIDLIGSSDAGIEDAIQTAIGRASNSMRNISWFEVNEIRGHVSDGEIAQYQVGLKVGFRLD